MPRFPIVASVAILLIVASMPLTVADGPIVPTLHGPTKMPAQRPHGFGGDLRADTTGLAVPLFDQRIDVFVDGVHAGTTRTDLRGTYAINVQIHTVGVHTMQAVFGWGTDVESRSANHTITVFATVPTQVANLSIERGFYWWQNLVTWDPPLSDGGMPITEYRLYRSRNLGAPVLVDASPSNLSYLDNDVTPGDRYWFTIEADNALGTNKNISREIVVDRNVTSVSLDGFWACHGGNCTFVTPSSPVIVPAGANVTVSVNVSGIADEYPMTPPGLSGKSVQAKVRSTTTGVMRTAHLGSSVGGHWQHNMTGFWQAAPAVGCEASVFDAFASLDSQAHSGASGDLVLCVP